MIRENIEEFTKKYAGQDKGISLIINRYKNCISRCTYFDFNDLPGLVMVACTDQGQPEDIKEQIRELIKRLYNTGKYNNYGCITCSL